MNRRIVFTGGAVVLAAGAALVRGRPGAVPPAISIAASPAPFSAGRPGPPAGHEPVPAHVTDRRRVVVYVAGEVRNPGVYTLPAGARAVDALHAAGGAANDADLVAVNLAEHIADGEEIAVPPKGVAAFASMPARALRGRRRRSSPVHEPRRGHRPRKEVPSEPVDVNRADAATLEALPGVGPALAARIVAFRELNGPFSSLDDLLDVNGMSESRLEEIAPYALVH